MSRIGKKPITLPKNVKISQSDGSVKVEGPKGILSSQLPEGISMTAVFSACLFNLQVVFFAWNLPTLR